VIILGADTSLPILSVALLRDENLIGAIALEGKGSRNEKLLPALDWLLEESGVERSWIDLFAVTRGPGSFTGVRIGLATIQGLAIALGKPVCAMSTHEAVGGEIVSDEAGRGEYYVTDARGPHLASSVPPGAVMVSDFLQRSNVAVACARRAWQIASQGNLRDYADATPIYVRLAEAEVKLRQKQNA
jgi:tRNA A37 threonylcarbamoyladenosine modification protein TsaB